MQAQRLPSRARTEAGCPDGLHPLWSSSGRDHQALRLSKVSSKRIGSGTSPHQSGKNWLMGFFVMMTKDSSGGLMDIRAFTWKNFFVGIVITLAVGFFLWKQLLHPPKGMLCVCGRRMRIREPTRHDCIIGGVPVAKIATQHFCPKCGRVDTLWELKPIAWKKTG